ncbi:MFS transporter [Streptosporangium lutulentum]
MHQRAYEGQCTAEEKRHTSARSPIGNPKLTLFALALGTFAIGTGEFGSNGIIQLFASDLNVSIPVATYAITAYAFGVVIGSPAIILLAVRVNRRTLLLGLIALFLVGNGLSALAPNIALLVVFRFVAGSVQGAFFGAGAVVAAYVYGPGQGGKAFATVMGDSPSPPSPGHRSAPSSARTPAGASCTGPWSPSACSPAPPWWPGCPAPTTCTAAPSGTS